MMFSSSGSWSSCLPTETIVFSKRGVVLMLDNVSHSMMFKADLLCVIYLRSDKGIDLSCKRCSLSI